MIDSILPHQPSAPSAAQSSHRLAVGVGVERPWDLAALLLAEPSTTDWPAAVLASMPPNVRLTAGPVRRDGTRITAARIGLLESNGSSGTVCLTFATTVARARVCGPFGGPLASDGEPPAEADVDGPVVKVFLRRYQWLHLDVEFAS